MAFECTWVTQVNSPLQSWRLKFYFTPNENYDSVPVVRVQELDLNGDLKIVLSCERSVMKAGSRVCYHALDSMTTGYFCTRLF